MSVGVNAASEAVAAHTWIQYRIVSRRPGRRWEFVPFTGASSADVERITKRLAELPAESPGFEFKLEQRSVTTTTTPWRNG